jgi:hypothetical protein
VNLFVAFMILHISLNLLVVPVSSVGPLLRGGERRARALPKAPVTSLHVCGWASCDCCEADDGGGEQRRRGGPHDSSHVRK